jgi:hypothetical protein
MFLATEVSTHMCTGPLWGGTELGKREGKGAQASTCLLILDPSVILGSCMC